MTLQSILLQTFKDFEIVICDDCSKQDNFTELHSFFNKNNFTNYKLFKHPKNVGIAKNFRAACELASGKYIKGIGPGDLLFCDSTLFNTIDFLEKKDSKVAFGLWQPYCINDNGSISYHEHLIPRDIRPHKNNDQSSIQEKIIVHRDRIAGATLIFNRAYILKPELDITPIVKHAEDLVIVLSALHGDNIDFLPHTFIWYELDSGISLTPNPTFKALMMADLENFYNFVHSKYSAHPLIIESFKHMSKSNFMKSFYAKVINRINHYKVSFNTKIPIKPIDGYLSANHFQQFMSDINDESKS